MDRYYIIKKYIDEFDYFSLLKNGAPDDEFDSYSRELAEQIQENDTEEKIADMIANRLDTAFGNEVHPEKFMEVAKKIKSALNNECVDIKGAGIGE